MPTKSLFPDIEIPEVDIWEFLFERKSREYPNDKLIYLDSATKRGYTHQEAKDAAVAFGKGLKANWEWERGDVLALFTPNSVDTPTILWGCQWAGGIVSPANPAYTADELAFQLKDSKSKAIVTQKPFLGVVKEAAKAVGIPENRIILLGDERDETGRFKHFTSIVNAAGTNRYRRTKLKADDISFLVYSSGTTGHPKGVMLSHKNIISNVLMLNDTDGINLSWKGGPKGDGDRLLGMLPFYHIYGLTCMIHNAMYAGLTLVIMAKFDIESFCQIIQDDKITFAYVVPPVVLLLGKSPVVDKYDFSSLRMLNSGAAPLTADLVKAVYDRLKIPVKQGYGLSETSPATHSQRWEDWSTFVGSVGRLLPNQTCKYVGEDGKEVPAGETGELWIKGPNIFQGYLNNPEGTANALTPDGYFKTGDVGHQDDKGNFYITDRVKELIKYKGFQVAPAELEGLLLGHPKVSDVCVVGVYNEQLASEVPRAYIVPAQGVQGDKATESEVMDWLSKKVAGHKKLRGGVRFVDVVPKSAAGKILRRVLKAKAKEEEENATRAKL